MRVDDDLMVASHGDLEVERLRRGGSETELDPDDTWPAPARPVLVFLACLLGRSVVVSKAKDDHGFCIPDATIAILLLALVSAISYFVFGDAVGGSLRRL